jgi:cytochrome c-type biogenesis protein CcmH
MLLGLVLALMMGIAVLAVLWPLSRARAARATGSDVAVYRAQLDEIERDRVAGTIAPTDADAARVEVSRRLIGAAEASSTPPPDVSSGLFRRRATAVAALVLMPAGAAVLYLALGSPSLPGQPRSARIMEQEQQQQSIATMIARVESHLEKNPDDGRGWEVIAPVYMRSGRFDDAVRAGRNILRTLGETPERQASLAEALIAQANGVVTAEAKTLLERVSAADAGNARAQFYLGLAAEQDGRRTDAAQIWSALIARAPADAPWLPAVREALARVDGAPPAPGPRAEDVAAAANMPAAERDQMVRAMVDRLAARLQDDGSDVDGWLRLMRAHMVLGDRDKARAAAADARKALKDAPEKLRRIEDGARTFGLDG